MCELYPEISLDQFFVPYTTTLSLNWRYEERDTLLGGPPGVSGSGGGGGGKEGENNGIGNWEECKINPVFERHLRDLGNWTLGPAFEKAFPKLKGTFKCKGG